MPHMPLNPGEIAMNTAPAVDLPDNTSCIPQHYLTYAHDLASVEAVIADIRFDARYPIFVSEDLGGIFIQIGIIGPDNYKDGPEKLVYGRRWRVEPNLPTSEIIQTVFLALKKAREHELRECFVLRANGRVSTPFNGHHDLPLLAQQGKSLHRVSKTCGSVVALLKRVKFEGVGFKLVEQLKTVSGQHILTLSKKSEAHGLFVDDLPAQMTLITPSLDDNDILYSLMEILIAQSDRFVEETFQYRGFARFSRNVDVMAIGRIGAQTRQCPTKLIPDPKQAQRFIARLKEENYETDETRIPQLSESAYAQDLKTQLAQMGVG